jgi:hypothetical protein
MRRVLLALVLGAVSLTPAVAAAPAYVAPQPFDLFRRVCLDTGGNMARVVATPDLAGFVNMPLPIPSTFEGGRLIDKAVRVKLYERDHMIMVMASRGEVTANGRKVPFVNCTVAYKPGELAPTLARVRAHVGFEPMALPKGAIGFHYSEKAGVRTPVRVAKLSELPAPASGARLAAIDLKTDKGVLVISYTLPRL